MPQASKAPHSRQHHRKCRPYPHQQNKGHRTLLRHQADSHRNRMRLPGCQNIHSRRSRQDHCRCRSRPTRQHTHRCRRRYRQHRRRPHKDHRNHQGRQAGCLRSRNHLPKCQSNRNRRPAPDHCKCHSRRARRCSRQRHHKCRLHQHQHCMTIKLVAITVAAAFINGKTTTCIHRKPFHATSATSQCIHPRHRNAVGSASASQGPPSPSASLLPSQSQSPSGMSEHPHS